MTMTTIDASHATLREIPVDKIDRNAENPRIIFRGPALEELTKSISRYGVQVPISVYREGSRYVLIDGERRWRCSVKLNRRTIPALVQEKPSVLTNLLLMFNIHALREQWDLLTLASKLPKVTELLSGELKRRPTEAEIADRTGLSRSTIRRSKLLIELPQHYIDEILQELKKPKAEQKLTEDFFIEMERALTTVQRAMPNLLKNRERARHILIDKYKRGVFKNRTDFRFLAKIARADRVAADKVQARRALDQVLKRNDYAPEQAFRDSVSTAYLQRDLKTRIASLASQLDGLTPNEIATLRGQLIKLLRKLQGVLGRS